MKYILVILAFVFSACRHSAESKPCPPEYKIVYKDVDTSKKYWVPFTAEWSDMGNIETNKVDVFFRSRLTGEVHKLSTLQLEAIRRRAYDFMYACEGISHGMREREFDSLTRKDPKTALYLQNIKK